MPSDAPVPEPDSESGKRQLCPAFKRQPVGRSRAVCAVSIPLVIAAGLLWRSGLMPLPPFYKKYGGDALWALLVFLGFGLVFRRASTFKVALMALCFSWAVEVSQIYHAPWIDSVRSTRLGGLVLGSTFNWPDLVAYAVGILLGVLAEVGLARSAQAQ